MLAPCLLAALHDPNVDEGVPAYVGAMLVAEFIEDLRKLRKAYTQEK